MKIELNNVHGVPSLAHGNIQQILSRIMQLDLAYFWIRLWHLLLYILHLSRFVILFGHFLA